MELIEANAEDVPLPDASFDLALSEYGASIWCDPYRWIPGGGSAACGPAASSSSCATRRCAVLCAPEIRTGKVGERLLRPQFGLHRMEWSGEDEGVDFQLPHGEWIRLLRRGGVRRSRGLWELQAPESAETHDYYDFVSAEWARKWPAEEIWKARKRG